MKHFLLLLALLTPPVLVSAQAASTSSAAQAAPSPHYKRHLVLITRPGPNFAKISDHRKEARAHHDLWKRLAEGGHTLAGGAFEGEPIMGMTVFSEGVNEAAARELIKDDPFPAMGFTRYEFRKLMVVYGDFDKR